MILTQEIFDECDVRIEHFENPNESYVGKCCAKLYLIHKKLNVYSVTVFDSAGDAFEKDIFFQHFKFLVGMNVLHPIPEGYFD